MKIFSTFEMKIVHQCEFYSGFLPFEHYARLRKINLFKSLKSSPSWLLRCIYGFYDIAADAELKPIASVYNVPQSALKVDPYRVISAHFANVINKL